jgi:hypothetical protein
MTASKGRCEMVLHKLLLLVSSILLLSACALRGAQRDEIPSKSGAFFAAEIEGDVVQYIWLEAPKRIEPGTQPVRVFMATTNPPEMKVPSMIDVPCELSSPDESLELGPATLPFEFLENGEFKSSYTWRACPKCDEQCYMPFEYTLYIAGTISQDTVSMELALLHFGKPAPVPFLDAELRKAEQTAKEPRMRCGGQGCDGIHFVNTN